MKESQAGVICHMSIAQPFSRVSHKVKYLVKYLPNTYLTVIDGVRAAYFPPVFCIVNSNKFNSISANVKEDTIENDESDVFPDLRFGISYRNM